MTVASETRGGPPPFSVDVESRPDVAVVVVTGELDLVAEPLLTATFAAVVPGPVPVIADLAAVTFCGSGCLGLLFAAHRLAAAEEQGFVLVTARRAVLKPLEILAMAPLMTIRPDREAAMRALGLPA